MNISEFLSAFRNIVRAVIGISKQKLLLEGFKVSTLNLLSIIFILSQTISSVFAGNIDFINEKTMKSYIRSNTWQISNSRFTGTGFSVQSDGISGIVTAFHVAQILLETGDIEDITLVNEKNNHSRRVKSFYFDTLNDLVLIKTIEGDDRGLSIGEKPPLRNEQVFLFGYSNEQFIDMNNISPISYEKIGDFYSFYVTYDNILRGASGGPVFNKKGEVIGVFAQGISNYAGEVSGLRNLKNFIQSCHHTASHCIKEEIENVKKLAENGDFIAQFRLADMLSYGRGMQKDKQQAMEWYKKSYQGSNEYGSGIAAIKVGMIYLEEVNDNPHTQAVRWSKEVWKAESEEDNHTRAEKWFREAVKTGSPLAEFNLGVLTKDERWFHRSAQDGFILAKKNCQSSFEN